MTMLYMHDVPFLLQVLKAPGKLFAASTEVLAEFSGVGCATPA